MKRYWYDNKAKLINSEGRDSRAGRPHSRAPPPFASPLVSNGTRECVITFNPRLGINKNYDVVWGINF